LPPGYSPVLAPKLAKWHCPTANQRHRRISSEARLLPATTACPLCTRIQLSSSAKSRPSEQASSAANHQPAPHTGWLRILIQRRQLCGDGIGVGVGVVAGYYGRQGSKGSQGKVIIKEKHLPIAQPPDDTY